MRKQTFLTKAASIAVCFGILLSNAASTLGGENGLMARDVELTREGTLVGQVCNSEGRALELAEVTLKFRGQQVASAVTGNNGEFMITGVRGGAHEMTVGSLTTSVRLWKNGTAPEGALEGMVIAADEQVVRGQEYDPYCAPACPPTGSGFGLIDVVTLALLATSVTGLVFAIENNNDIDDLQDQLNQQASP
jgi:hypothetical protein